MDSLGAELFLNEGIVSVKSGILLLNEMNEFLFNVLSERIVGKISFLNECMVRKVN